MTSNSSTTQGWIKPFIHLRQPSSIVSNRVGSFLCLFRVLHDIAVYKNDTLQNFSPVRFVSIEGETQGPLKNV